LRLLVAAVMAALIWSMIGVNSSSVAVSVVNSTVSRVN
jgi:hypothetical protein